MKYLLYIITLSTFLFSQDTTPPYYYYSDDIEGPSVEFSIPNILDFSNNNFPELWLDLQGPLGCCAIIDDESGIYNAGYRFISPTGEINDIYVRGEMEYINATGSWSEYLAGGHVEIEYVPGNNGIFMVQFGLLLPPSIIENGLYQIEFIATDNVGNQLIIAGNELAELNYNGSSTIEFIGLDGNDDSNPPYYIVHPDYGSSIEIDFPTEVIEENSVFNFSLYWNMAVWLGYNYDYLEELNIFTESALYDDESGVHKVGFRFTSPMGVVNDILLSNTESCIDVSSHGTWSSYISEPWIGCCTGQCLDANYNLILPTNIIEIGIYQVDFIAVDYEGNELIVNDDELEQINLNGNSTITFISDNENEDTDPPYYYFSDEIDGPSLELMFDEVINFDNSSGVLTFNIYGELGCCAILDDGSGINSVGYRFISPSGSVDDIMLGGMHPNNFLTGSWSEYVSSAYAFMDANSFDNLEFQLVLPYTIIEYGTYQLQLVAIDNAGNELIVDGAELAMLNINHNSNIMFESSQNTTALDIYDDYTILSWDWGIGDNIIIQESAFSLFEISDTLYVVDENALISSDCNDLEPYGIGILDKHIIDNDIDEFALYANGSIDDCNEYNLRFPGFIKGNSMKFKYFDYSDNMYYDLSPNYGSGNGIFGVPFDDTLTFKYFDSSNNLIYNINEQIIFQNDMIIGDAINYYEFTIDENSSQSGNPNWDFDLYYYQNNGSITSSLLGLNVGDRIAAFAGDEIRGVATAVESPFDTVVFLMLTYSNPTVTTVSYFEVGEPTRINLFNQNIPKQQDRSTYKYNIYKNGSLIEEDYTSQYYYDYDFGSESCYEIYLKDNYDNTEFLSTDEVCYYLQEDQQPQANGDMNNDTLVNVVDVVLIIDIILNNGSYNVLGDVNSDGILNVVDVVIIIDWILNP